MSARGKGGAGRVRVFPPEEPGEGRGRGRIGRVDGRGRGLGSVGGRGRGRGVEATNEIIKKMYHNFHHAVQ
jgi:hypothetical protein